MFWRSGMSPLSILHQIKCHFWLIIYIVAIFPAKPRHSCAHTTHPPLFPSIPKLLRLLMLTNPMQPKISLSDLIRPHFPLDLCHLGTRHFPHPCPCLEDHLPKKNSYQVRCFSEGIKTKVRDIFSQSLGFDKEKIIT